MKELKEKKIGYSEYAYFFGMLIFSLSSALMAKSGFGVSLTSAPAYVLYVKASLTEAVTFGSTEYTFQALVLIFLFALVGRWKKAYLFSFASAVFYAFSLDAFINILNLIPTNIFIRIAYMVVTAGCMFSHYFFIAHPASFTFMRSFDVLTMVVLGGLGSMTGSIVGAMLLTGLSAVLSDFPEWRMIIYSITMIVLMLYRPQGLFGNEELSRNMFGKLLITGLLAVAFCEYIDEIDRSLFHIDGDRVDLSEDVVVEDLENHSDDQTTDGCDQSDLHTTCDNVRRDITSLLDIIECLDHTDNGSEESERRCDGDEERNPRKTVLHLAHLN